jgi:hypothetical protein
MSVSRPFLRDTIPATYNGFGVISLPHYGHHLLHSGGQGDRSFKPNVYLHPIPTLKLQVGQDRKVPLPLAPNIAVEVAALLFCVQKVRRSCFSPKTSYFWSTVCFFFFFGECVFQRNLQYPKFGLKRFLTNPFPFYYALFTVCCIYLPFVASLNKHQWQVYFFYVQVCVLWKLYFIASFIIPPLYCSTAIRYIGTNTA